MADNQKDSNNVPGLWDTLLVEVRIATMSGTSGYGIIEDGAIGIQDGRIVWVGAMEALPDTFERLASDVIECGHIWITPGLIDCHTHLVHGGHYHASVEAVLEATREVTEDQLLQSVAKRLVSLLEEGVTTVGIRFGYGSDSGIEKKISHAAGLLSEIVPMHLLPQFDGMRTLPEALAGSKEAYSEEGVQSLAAVKKMALLLPGVFYTMGMTQKPFIDSLRRHDVPVILSTDCNPLTSPCTSLLLILNMACRLFGLTPLEALSGVTRFSAQAMGVANDAGTIDVGKLADLALWDIGHPDELSGQLGFNPCIGIIKDGVLRRTRD